MSEPINPSVSLSIDMKKYRIRIYKTTLHLLGDPSYIQLLVNPVNGDVAIQSVDHVVSGDQTHKVSKKAMASDNSIEIYSRSFITRLIDVAGELDRDCLYQMSGRVIPSKRIAVFSLKAMTKKTS
ncbi:MAG: hypothetical protein IKF90_24710 [Parasporobacterium sp.]|nr:hypothetical protein [Parasporobacterium sp.]